MPVRNQLLPVLLLWTTAICTQAASVTIEVPPLRYQPETRPAPAGSGTDVAAPATPVRLRIAPLRYVPGTPDLATPSPPTSPAATPPQQIRTGELRYVSSPAAAQAQAQAQQGSRIRTPPLSYRSGAAEVAAESNTIMRYPTFDPGPVSTRRLAVDSATASTARPYTVRYSGLDPERRYYLHAWLTSARRARITAQHAIAQDESSGTWSPILETAGHYRICLTPADDALHARRSPDNAAECLEANAVWGEPESPPEPVVSITPQQPVAGKDFELSFSGMPREANAKIFIYAAGAEQFAHPTDSVVTKGRERGSRKLRIYDAGDYEIRVVYERGGRQTRATRPLQITERQEESER